MSLFNFVTVEFFNKSKEYISSVISGIVPTVFVSSVGYAILISSIGYFIFDFIGLPLKYYLLIPILSFLYNVKAICLTVLRNDSKPIAFGLLNNSSTTLYLILTLSLVVGLGYDWEGRVNAEIFTALIMCFVSLFILKKEGYLNKKISRSILKENFKYSSPLIPGLFALTLINLSDRFFLKEMVGDAELGLYSIGNSLGMIITFILYSFEQISIPLIYKRLSENKEFSKIQLVKFTNIYISIIFVLVVLVTAGSYVLLDLNFLPEKYLPARQYIFWIAIAYGLWGMCAIIAPYIDYYKKTQLLLKAAVIGCIVNLICNYFFILQFGAIGAAYSKVLTFLIVFILYGYYGNKLEPMPWFTIKSFSYQKSDLEDIFRL